MRLAPALLGLPLLAAPPAFTVKDAIQAEWRRQPPVFTDAEKAALPAADRARLELTLKRIGAPGTPALLPPELEKPTVEAWEAKARAARTPQERLTALHFLNRLKSPKALLALEGLKPADAKTWPRHLHLDAGLATARLNGGDMSPALRDFMDALKREGKVDPVRAQTAQLRLMMAGKEKALLPPVKATPGAVLALMDAWNRSPKPDGFDWTAALSERARLHQSFHPSFLEGTEWSGSSLQSRESLAAAKQMDELMWVRFAEAKPTQLNPSLAPYFARHWTPHANPTFRFWTLPMLEAFPKDWAQKKGTELMGTLGARELGQLLPILGKTNPPEAAVLRGTLLTGSDPLARAAAIDDFPEAPADLDALVKTLWKCEEYDGVQVLLQSLEKWKLPEDQRKALLRHFYEHPCWTARLDAFTQLRKLDPAAPWPAAPEPTPVDRELLETATRLATAGKPVQVRLTFAGKRTVVLKLDPVNAPLNVANFVRLARKGFFNGRLVPRVVPDFVVQMGSPVDTMDGGPGYTVRCENSLTWYGPGTVGMALSGKDTGGSQFFITTNATPHLTGRYTRLGDLENPDRALKLLDDLELAAKLERVEVL